MNRRIHIVTQEPHEIREALNEYMSHVTLDREDPHAGYAMYVVHIGAIAREISDIHPSAHIEFEWVVTCYGGQTRARIVCGRRLWVNAIVMNARIERHALRRVNDSRGR